MARLRAIDILQFSQGPLPAAKAVAPAAAAVETRQEQPIAEPAPIQLNQKWDEGDWEDWEPVPSMERTNVLRQTIIALCAAVWVFLLLSLGSFHPTDWPSHDVYPYPPIQNLCGTVGAFIAYYSFLAIGQGVFPI